MKHIRIIGGGLAGPEAALQAASLGCTVTLYEMRPHRSTEAHQTADFAELVCSNSLKSESEFSAPWLLKQEMRQANSFLLQDADATAVPAGHALAVDRLLFSERVRDRLEQHPNITIVREEITTLDENSPDTITILATGPLTSPALAAELQRLTGADHLAFYDSISPIVDATTIDMEKVYFAARWNRGTADYINCPFTREEYDRFLDALTTAETIAAKSWEALPADANPTHLATTPELPPPRSSTTSWSSTSWSQPPRTPPLSLCCHLDRSAAQWRDLLLYRSRPTRHAKQMLHPTAPRPSHAKRVLPLNPKPPHPKPPSQDPTKAPVLRRLPPHRGDRPPRPRHPPLRPHEARRPRQPQDRPLALRRRPASPGKPPRRQLQPRRLPEPPQVLRAGPRPPPHPRP